jgi:hypothetical protein
MQVVTHDGITAHLNAEEPRKVAWPIENPDFTVRVITIRVRVDAAKEGSSHATSDTVINTDMEVIDDIAASTGRHVSLHHHTAGGERERVYSQAQ